MWDDDYDIDAELDYEEFFARSSEKEFEKLHEELILK